MKTPLVHGWYVPSPVRFHVYNDASCIAHSANLSQFRTAKHAPYRDNFLSELKRCMTVCVLSEPLIEIPA